MARTIEEIVREQVEIQEEHDRLWREAQEAEEAGLVQLANSQWKPVFSEEDLQNVNADDVERAVDRFHEDANIAEAWLAKEEKLNMAIATIDQRDAKVEELLNDKCQLVVNLDQAKGINDGLREVNADLTRKLDNR